MEWIPRTFYFDNYTKPFTQTNFGIYFATAFWRPWSRCCFRSSLLRWPGFGLAKYNYFGKNLVFLAILATMMLPVQVILIPLYLVVQDFGWLDTYRV